MLDLLFIHASLKTWALSSANNAVDLKSPGHRFLQCTVAIAFVLGVSTIVTGQSTSSTWEMSMTTLPLCQRSLVGDARIYSVLVGSTTAFEGIQSLIDGCFRPVGTVPVERHVLQQLVVWASIPMFSVLPLLLWPYVQRTNERIYQQFQLQGHHQTLALR